jgi:acetyl-CoA synthetase (ADP-forming)
MPPFPPSSPVSELLSPRSVAVIGASEDQTKFGGRLYRMLLKHGYPGTVYPINPGRETLFGIRTFPSVSATPEAPDMVVMALPRDKVRGEIEASARRGARCGIVITAKFSDAGPEGAALEREIVAIARAHGMRLIGPNCLGVISPANRVILCSTPALDVDRLPVGPIGFVSQSGALMATVFDRAMAAGTGFSHCVSVGNQADLELADFVDYLIDDPRTSVICSYVEGIKDPARFVALARRAREAGKPWLIVKAGRTEAGTRAAFSHTASIAGSHAVLASVCRDEQVTLLEEPGAMIALAAVMARHPHATVGSAGVAVITTSGGGGALAVDALTARGVPLARFGEATRARLDALYPPEQANNPIDLGGRRFDEAADVSRSTGRIVRDDPDTDLVLVAITTAPALPALAAEMTAGLSADDGSPVKPTFWVMQPGHAADVARGELREHGVPYTDFTGEAIDAIAAWHARAGFVPRDPAVRPAGLPPDTAALQGTLDEAASKAAIARWGVPVNTARLAVDRGQALAAARSFGGPVAMKIVSPDIVHKSDVGGVRLDVRGDDAVAAAFDELVAAAGAAVPGARIDGVSVQAMAGGTLELILGARRDPQFGPIVVVGAGGVLVEMLPEPAIARAPLAPSDARRLLASLAVWPVLAGFRGRPLAIDAVVDALVAVSWLAADLGGRDFELDVNPLRVSHDGCCAVDARLRVD